jgi:hypothetical protein
MCNAVNSTDGRRAELGALLVAGRADKTDIVVETERIVLMAFREPGTP